MVTAGLPAPGWSPLLDEVPVPPPPPPPLSSSPPQPATTRTAIRPSSASSRDSAMETPLVFLWIHAHRPVGREVRLGGRDDRVQFLGDYETGGGQPPLC